MFRIKLLSSHRMLALVFLLSIHQLNYSIQAQTFSEWAQKYLDEVELNGAQVGIQVRELQSGRKIFGWNDGVLMKPASAAKIISGGLFLTTFGPEYRIKTPIYLRKPTSDNQYSMGLAICGRGDFSMGARFFDWDYQMGLSKLEFELEKLGIKGINGPIIIEDSYFKNSKYGTGWTWEDLQHYYGAPTSSIVHDDNVVDLTIRPGSRLNAPCSIEPTPKPVNLHWINKTTTNKKGARKISISRGLNSKEVIITGSLPLGSKNWVGSVSNPEPANWFGIRVKEWMIQQRIAHKGKVSVIGGDELLPMVDGWKKVAEVDSFPVHVMLNHMLKKSQNLYAQTMLLLVGKENPNHDKFESTELAGIDSLKIWARSMNISRSSLLIDEGSGLSRSSLITPEALCSILIALNKQKYGALFKSALPRSGHNGSLKYRLLSSHTKNRVWAKPGSIKWVKSLAGYVDRRDGTQLVFTIMLNGYSEDVQNKSGKKFIDELVEKLASLKI